MTDLLQKVIKTINHFKMLPPGKPTVLVAVSGGPDSIALADLLYRLEQEGRLSLCLAHLDHMFRGAESAEDASFVQAWAESRDLPVLIESRKVDDLKLPGESKQEAARRVRYQFLGAAAQKTSAQRVALAHTRTDQAETVLMRLISGGGAQGLSGIPPIRDEFYIRPLITISRQEILAYCQLRGLDYRTDPSNYQPVYRRNKIRLELVPFIKAHFNPKVEEALARTAEILRAEDDYLNQAVQSWFNLHTQPSSENSISFPIQELLAQPLALQRRILRQAYAELSGGATLNFDQVEDIIWLLQKEESNLELHFSKVWVEKGYRFLRFVQVDQEQKKNGNNVTIDREWTLTVPGSLNLPVLGYSLTAEVLLGGEALLNQLRAEEEGPQGFTAYFDLDVLTPPLQIRPRSPGDVFVPFGSTGKKKVKDLFIDEKVLPGQREKIPVILDKKGIIWIAGLRQGERGRITSETTKILRLRLAKIPRYMI